MQKQNKYQNKTVAFHTLGCKLNFSETSTIGRLFVEEGFQKVGFEEKADVYVINTCSVTNIADKKCKQTIKKAIKTSPEAFIVVTGCYAQLKPDEIANIEGVDVVLGANDKFNALKFIGDLKKKDRGEVYSCHIRDIDFFNTSYSIDERTRSFLKVQDGCNYNCSFCTIPKARGKSRSSTIDHIVKKTDVLVQKGIKEVVLTGINIGDFGKLSGETFLGLLKSLEKNTDIERFRVSSIEPNLLTNEIIDFISQSQRFVPHFHIPLQSGSDKILKLMKRRYNVALFKGRIERIKSIVPDAFIGVDVICGFNSESQDDFQETYQFLERLDISQLHVFTYSEREGTKALNITPVVAMAERKRRSRVLQGLSNEKQKRFYESQIGKTAQVLFENQNYEGKSIGFTQNYLRVEVPFREEFKNTLQSIKLGRIAHNGNFLAEQLVVGLS